MKPHYSEESVQVEENVLIPRLLDADQKVPVALNLLTKYPFVPAHKL